MNSKITYHKEGAYYIPDLYLEKENYKNDYQIGKYGQLRLQYLKEHKKAEYTIMLLEGTLRKHIVDTDIQAKERLETLIKQMLDKNPIDENSKDTDTLKLAGLMNNYKHSVEEIIYKELICYNSRFYIKITKKSNRYIIFYHLCVAASTF